MEKVDLMICTKIQREGKSTKVRKGEQDKTEKTTQNETRQDKTEQGKTEEDKSRQEWKRQGKKRWDRTRQGKTRQDEMHHLLKKIPEIISYQMYLKCRVRVGDCDWRYRRIVHYRME